MEFPSSSSQNLDEHDLLEELFRDEDNLHQSDHQDNSNNIEEHPQNQPARRKRHDRHSRQQIQRLEEVFKYRPHPDDNEREALAAELQMEPQRVKFWFQNKRTQTKNKQVKSNNKQLQEENEKLQAQNQAFKEVLLSALCTDCGGPSSSGGMSIEEHLLRAENAMLTEEISRVSKLIQECTGKSVMPSSCPPLSLATSSPLPAGPSADPNVPNMAAATAADHRDQATSSTTGAVGGSIEMDDNELFFKLAEVATEELLAMALQDQPLWVPAGPDCLVDVLDQNEYFRNFSKVVGDQKPYHWTTEGTRATAMVPMSSNSLVEIFMDTSKWTAFFSEIVSRAMTIEIVSTGGANYNRALELISAEYHLPSPLVPKRKSLFLRHCQRRYADKLWVVVDVSLDIIRPSPVMRCRRRPSGCVIQELPEKMLKVIWVEHVESDNSFVHNMYKPAINCGFAFGAKRWLAALERQCNRLTSVISFNVPDGNVSPPPAGHQTVLKVAERMVLGFRTTVMGYASAGWDVISGSGADDVLIMSRNAANEPGRPHGVVLSASIAFWSPIEQKRIFDFLHDGSSRAKWDIISNGGVFEVIAQITIGKENDDCILLLHVHGVNSNENVNKEMTIIQESSYDESGSYLIYAPIAMDAMNRLLIGGDPDKVPLLSSGFSIVPDGISRSASGSLVTVSFQILVDPNPDSQVFPESVATVKSLVMCTVDRMKRELVELGQ